MLTPAQLLFALELLFIVLFATSVVLFGQDRVPPPSKCDFEPAFGVIGDSLGRKRFIKDRSASDVYNFYNDDGSLWYAVAWHEANPLYYGRNDNPEFRPVKPMMQSGPEVRLVAECDHWYKVIVNEASKTARFVLKSDPLFVKKDWETTIVNGAQIRVDLTLNPLRQKPDGDVLKPIPDGLKYLQPIEIRGAWVFVSGKSETTGSSASGWVRWRDGDELLIAFWITDHYNSKRDAAPTKY